ncbi:unnamed protein product [Brachionus calyciflorus]|uniref:Rhophilin-2 n=1 Tax=Brachionus calyciflorus TaxID=104777 RepID=A0A813M527_9BILA|nr:unnamed protein product [Brachionus calyciflorus]
MIRHDVNSFLKDYRVPMQKYYNIHSKFELNRQKRSEINDLINKELRIKHGAINLLKVCCNEQIENNLKLEVAFSESNVKYLKDQLAELNCDLTLAKMKSSYHFNKQKFIYNRLDSNYDSTQTDSLASSTSSSSTSSSYNLNSPNNNNNNMTIKNLIFLNQFNSSTLTESCNNEIYVNEMIPIAIPAPNNHSYSISPSSSSSIKSTPAHTNGSNTPILKKNECTEESGFQFSLDEYQTKTVDIMIYLNLKETISCMDFTNGFKSFISSHYRENPNNLNEQIKQFNYFRESTIRICSEPSEESVGRLFEYYNSLNLIEKRFFQQSQCYQIHFTWYDSINGIESAQKSIQFEKASILFNCSALFSQLAAICCDINDRKLEDQLNYWLKAAGCVNYLNTNFSNSPSLDMSPFMLYFFNDIFVSQAYEIKAKMLMLTINELDLYDPKHCFISFTNCCKIYAHLANIYGQLNIKLSNNASIKSYLPEIWYFLIKVKSLYYNGLSHYYAGLALSLNGLESISHMEDVQNHFEKLYDKTKIKTSNIPVTNLNEQTTINSHKSYFQKLIHDQQILYSPQILNTEKRISLAKSHMRESIIQQEEAIRQHSFCRKFSKDDYLHTILQHYHELSLDKFMQLENQCSADFNDELLDLLPLNTNLPNDLSLNQIEPNFEKYISKDFFNIIGPLKVYSSENELSIPYSCILRKLPNNPTFGITVKGDCPVRINNVDPNSYAYSAGIREGDFIIAIQDHDVRWSKHAQVVAKIRSQITSVKLTLISVRQIPKEIPIFCQDNEFNKIKNCSDKIENAIMTPSSRKKILSNNFNTTEPSLVENHIWWNKENDKKPSSPKTERQKQRIFKLPQNSTKSHTRSKSPFINFVENNIVTSTASKLCNLARNTSSNLHEKHSRPKLASLFMSTNNLYAQNIGSDKEDEVKENSIFWDNLKSIKTPLTNTITLGRKFKKNVLKLSIFNTFNNNSGNGNENKDEIDKSKDANSENEHISISNANKMPPLPPNVNCTVKLAKTKKKNKIKELMKLTQNDTEKLLLGNNKNDIIYKTI